MLKIPQSSILVIEVEERIEIQRDWTRVAMVESDGYVLIRNGFYFVVEMSFRLLSPQLR